MDLVLSGLQGVELYVYLADIIVFATDLEEQSKKFRRLMKHLDEANLTLELSKSQFLQREASFLGHIAGNGKIRLVPTNKKKITQILRPGWVLSSVRERFRKNSIPAIYLFSFRNY